MTIRQKTVEYAFDTLRSSIATNTRTPFTQITIYIPENSSRTFRSVVLEVWGRENGATPASITSHLVGFRLAAAAFSDVTDATTYAQSGENWSTSRYRIDLTSHFTSNFGSGTSQTADCEVTFVGSSVVDATARLFITYDYDDSGQTTQVKTVRIPFDGTIAALTMSLAQIGTNQVPLLDTFLPEESKTFRNIFFDIVALQHASGAANFNLGVQLDAGSEVSFATQDGGNASGPLYHVIWVQNSLDTSAVHAFNARSAASAHIPLMTVTLVVTYEFNDSTTTSVMNHAMIPLLADGGHMGGSASGDASRLFARFQIEEPGTITLFQSGVILYHSDNGDTTAIVSAGGGSTRSYVLGIAVDGARPIGHRVDSGGAGGAGLSLARGENTIAVNVYRTTTGAGNLGTFLNGCALINYTSSKHASGTGVHNHTVIIGALGTLTNTRIQESAAVAPAIPETNYWTTAFGVCALTMHAGSTSGGGGVAITSELLSGEGPADGWRNIYAGIHTDRNEFQNSYVYQNAQRDFDRWPADNDTNRQAVETARKYRVQFGATQYSGLILLCTYHAITFAIAGTLSGYTGDGSGITVEAYSPTYGLIGTTTSAVGGTFTIPWYDNTAQVFARAEQDGTHLGVSLSAYAA